MQSIDIELEMARTCFGELTLEQRNRLLAYYEYPSDETWDDVYNLTIMPYGHINTVWQAVCAIDPASSYASGTSGGLPLTDFIAFCMHRYSSRKLITQVFVYKLSCEQ